MTARRLPLTVIGGYLGAGKTTLLNHMLSQDHGLRMAVIVNDFGAVNIDAGLIRSRDGETMSLTNGCMCCKGSDGTAATLARILARAEDFDHIVIEASGVAEPGKIALNAHGFRLPLDGVLVLVDAEQVRQQADNRYVGDVVRRQLKQADLILLNKTDLLDPADLGEVRGFLDLVAPGIPRIETMRSAAPVAALFGTSLTGVPRAGWASSVKDHAIDYRSWVERFPEPIARARFESLAEGWAARALRAKGHVALEEAPDIRYLYQQVGRRWTLNPDGAWDEPASLACVVLIELADGAGTGSDGAPNRTS